MQGFDKYDVILSKPEEHTKFMDGQSGKQTLLEYKWIYLKSIKKFEGIYGWNKSKGKIEMSLL